MKFRIMQVWALGFGILALSLPACQKQDGKVLLKACRQCQTEQAQAFLSAMGSLKNKWLMREALLVALRNGCTEIVKQLLRSGADAYLNSMLGGMYPLSWAVRADGPEMARALIAAGADVNPLEVLPSETPLMDAARRGQSETVRLLIESGADVNAKDRNGETAICYATHFKHTEHHAQIMLALIAAGADVNVGINLRENQPLIMAVSWIDLPSYDEVLRAIIKAGANVNEGYAGMTPLLYAAEQGNEARMRMLLEAGAHVKVADKKGMTPLMFVSEMGHVDLMRAMIQAGADVNAQNNEGKTALMLAVHQEKVDAVRLLLDSGADVNLKDKEGRTAIQDPKIEVQNILQSAVAR